MAIDYSKNLFDDYGRPIQVSYVPAGAIYENQKSMAADTATRFETASKKLRSARIYVTTQNMVFGDSTNQRLTVAANDYFDLESFDLSTLYFKNASAGQNGTVTIIGVIE